MTSLVHFFPLSYYKTFNSSFLQPSHKVELNRILQYVNTLSSAFTLCETNSVVVVFIRKISKLPHHSVIR